MIPHVCIVVINAFKQSLRLFWLNPLKQNKMDETVRTADDEIAADGATSSDSREHEQESPDLSRRPPSQPRISWSKESAKRRQGFRRSPGSARADDRVKSSEDSERPDGLFRTLTGLVQAALRWRRLDSVTPGNSQASDSRFLDASKKTPGTKDDSIALKSTQDQVKGNGVHSEYKTSRYINPAYVPRYSDSEDPDIEDVPEVPAGYRAYESGIYSVNAGGTPVPITIEETVPDDVPSGEFEILRGCNTRVFKICIFRVKFIQSTSCDPSFHF